MNRFQPLLSALRMTKSCALAVVLLAASCAAAPAAAPNVMIGTDMGHTDLYFFKMDTDQRIKVDLSKDPMWPGGGALHTIITPDGKKAYLSRDELRQGPSNGAGLANRRTRLEGGQGRCENHKGDASSRAK